MSRAIDRNAMLDEVVYQLAKAEDGLAEATALAYKDSKLGNTSDMVDDCARAIGFAYARNAYQYVYKMLKSNAYELEDE